MGKILGVIVTGEDQVSFRSGIEGTDDIWERPVPIGCLTQEGIYFQDPVSLKSLDSPHDVLIKTQTKISDQDRFHLLTMFKIFMLYLSN